jgi:WXG100 family type VII secretion target
MADLIAAQEGALASGANAVASTRSGIDQQVKAVRGEIEQAGSYWSGAAATSYVQLMQRWDQETSKLNNILNTLEDALRGTAADQAATEEQHQQTISGLSSIMGA